MDTKLLEVLTKIIDSDDTTAGGGASAALCGAMAAGMISMVAKLSKKKPVNYTVEQYDEIAEECDKLAEKLKQGSKDDISAYCMIVDAYKLPKENDEQKAARSAAVVAAAIKAAEVPRDNGFNNMRVFDLGSSLMGNSNPACASDLLTALYIVKGGIKACALNIEANLSMIKDEAARAEFTADMKTLLLKAIEEK